MPTPVQFLSAVVPNTTTSNPFEDAVKPFSIGELLVNKVDAETVTDDSSSQDFVSSDLSDDHTDPTASDYLLYWSLTQTPLPTFVPQPMITATADTLSELESTTLLMTTASPDVTYPSAAQPNEQPIAQQDALHSPTRDILQAIQLDLPLPVNKINEQFAPESSQSFKTDISTPSPIMVTRQALGHENEINKPLQSVDPSVVLVTPSSADGSLRESEMQDNISDGGIPLLAGQEEAYHLMNEVAEEIQTPVQIAIQSVRNEIPIPAPLAVQPTQLPQQEEAIDLSTNDESAAEKSPVEVRQAASSLSDLPMNFQVPLMKQKPSTASSDDSLFTFAGENNTPQVQQSTDMHLNPVLSSKNTDTNNEPNPSLQTVTKHLNDFLSQGMSTQSVDQTSPAWTKSGFDANAQIKMELLSLQQDPVAAPTNFKIENYTAQIKLHPQDLGQITAKIEVNAGATTITFLTEHAHVKQLMEGNLQSLRHAFQDSNLNLGFVDVHHDESQQKKEQSTYTSFEEDEDLVRVSEVGQKPFIHEKKTSQSVVDTYA